MRSLALVALLSGTALADRTPKQQEADKLFKEGRERLNAHDPKGACEKFELAIAADPTAAGTMLNLGLCYEQLGKPHSALKWFRRAQTKASESGRLDSEEAAKQHTADLANKVPVISIVFTGAPPSDTPRVRVDDELVGADELAHLEIDPGDHVIEVRAAHRKLSRGHIQIAPRDPKVNEAVEVKVALEAGEATVVVDRGRNQRLVAYGLGVVALGAWTFDFFYGVSKSKRYHCAIDPLPNDDCYNADKVDPVRNNIAYANDRVNDLKYKGTAIFVVGAAALATGIYLFVSAPGKTSVESLSGVSLAPVLAPDQVGFAIAGGF